MGLSVLGLAVSRVRRTPSHLIVCCVYWGDIMSSTSDYLPFGRSQFSHFHHHITSSSEITGTEILHTKNPRGGLVTMRGVFLGLTMLFFGLPCLSFAQNANSATKLMCGAPPVTDSYQAIETTSGEEPVGEPLNCEQADAIARSLNEANGCCLQNFAASLRKRAEQRARRSCSARAGYNFACDIYVTDDTICTEGCGMTTRPTSDPNGCTTDPATTYCSSSARVVPVAGGQCAIMCAVSMESQAFGDFDVSCSACTADENCGGAADAKIEKEKRVSELEAKKDQLKAELAALNPQTPNYSEIVNELKRDLLTIVGELNTLYSFFQNLKKLFFGGKSPADCQ